jgi:hypothetical protein
MLLTVHGSLVEGKRLIPSAKEQRDITEEINDAINKLYRVLDLAGPIILSRIAKNTGNSLKIFHDMKQNLLAISQACIRTKLQLAPVKKGRHRDPLKLAFMHHLVGIYIKATEKEPTCGPDSIKENHVEECFEFIANINSFILKSLNLHFENEGTLGQYLCEILKDRKDCMLIACVSIFTYQIKPEAIHPSIIPFILNQFENALLILKMQMFIT